MTKYKDQLERELDTARSSETTSDELDVLAESPYEAISIAVAEHPRTKPFTLATLVPMSIQSPYDLYIADALARNSNSPDYALKRLAWPVIRDLSSGPDREKCFEVCVALCANGNTPFEEIAKLLAPSLSWPELRLAVARETQRQDVLLLLHSDRSEVVRKQARQSLQSISSSQ